MKAKPQNRKKKVFMGIKPSNTPLLNRFMGSLEDKACKCMKVSNILDIRQNIVRIVTLWTDVKIWIDTSDVKH